MRIEFRNIDTIRPYENNPRINDKAVDAVAASLREFGFRQPIVVDKDGVITKRGDIWILGNHRLMCGDSGSAADVDKLLNGESIHLVNTDPPYNVCVAPRNHKIYQQIGPL